MMYAEDRHRIVDDVGEISVLVVDDHALFADAVQARLSREPDLGPVWVAYSVREARSSVSTRLPTVVVLDEALGDGSGVELAGELARSAPQTRIVMLTGGGDSDLVVTALVRGARAWLPKTVDADHLVRVVRGVTRGEVWLAPDLLGRVLDTMIARTVSRPPDPLATLTVREREVLQCLVDGLSRPEIAARLHISPNTLRTHTQNLIAKLGVHSTLESVAIALRHGIRTSDS